MEIIKECRTDEEVCCKGPTYHAYQILRFAFTFLPIIAGLDKFFNHLTVWTQYLSTPFNVFHDAHTTMLVVGAIEILVGILVWVKPKIFSYVVAAWLLAIIVNLLILGKFYDTALRDFGLLLGALALGSLSCKYDRCCHKEVVYTEKTIDIEKR